MSLQVGEWLSIKDIAERYNVPVATVRTWRRLGRAPRGHKIGKHVRFHLSDVTAWEIARVDQRGQA